MGTSVQRSITCDICPCRVDVPADAPRGGFSQRDRNEARLRAGWMKFSIMQDNGVASLEYDICPNHKDLTVEQLTTRVLVGSGQRPRSSPPSMEDYPEIWHRAMREDPSIYGSSIYGSVASPLMGAGTDRESAMPRES